MNEIIASSDNAFPRYWYLTIDDDVMNIDKTKTGQFIDTVLTDLRGVAKLGYLLVRVEEFKGRFLRNYLPDSRRFIFNIRISSNETIKSECNLHNLSCAKLTENEILINAYRWNFGSVESGVNLTDYRIYLINHEILHLLGRGHKECKPPALRSVMIQQTISNDLCTPNVWPLLDD